MMLEFFVTHAFTVGSVSLGSGLAVMQFNKNENSRRLLLWGRLMNSFAVLAIACSILFSLTDFFGGRFNDFQRSDSDPGFNVTAVLVNSESTEVASSVAPQSKCNARNQGLSAGFIRSLPYLTQATGGQSCSASHKSNVDTW